MVNTISVDKGFKCRETGTAIYEGDCKNKLNEFLDVGM